MRLFRNTSDQFLVLEAFDTLFNKRDYKAADVRQPLNCLTNFLIKPKSRKSYETNRQHHLHHWRGHGYWPWPRRSTAQARQQSHYLGPPQGTSGYNDQGEPRNGF